MRAADLPATAVVAGLKRDLPDPFLGKCLGVEVADQDRGGLIVGKYPVDHLHHNAWMWMIVCMGCPCFVEGDDLHIRVIEQTVIALQFLVTPGAEGYQLL